MALYRPKQQASSDSRMLCTAQHRHRQASYLHARSEVTRRLYLFLHDRSLQRKIQARTLVHSAAVYTSNLPQTFVDSSFALKPFFYRLPALMHLVLSPAGIY